MTPFDRIENAAIALINWEIIPDEFVAEVKAALSDAEAPLRAELAQASADRAALDVAVRGLRELEEAWARRRDQVEYGESPRAACVVAVAEISALLDKIRGTR